MTDLLMGHDLFADEDPVKRQSAIRSNASSRAADEVEALSRHFVNRFNACEYDDIQLTEHIADDFSGKHDQFPSARSFAEMVDLNQRMAQQYPDVQEKVINTSVQIHDRQAKVLCFILSTGYPDGIRRQTVTVFKWLRRQQKWVLRHVHATGSVHPARARLFEERVSVGTSRLELLETFDDVGDRSTAADKLEESDSRHEEEVTDQRSNHHS